MQTTKPVNAREIVAGWRQLSLLQPDEAVREVARETLYRRHRVQPEVIDRVLDAIDVNEFSDRTLIAILVSTAPMANDLHAREFFAHRVRLKFIEDKGTRYAKEQLMGLT